MADLTKRSFRIGTHTQLEYQLAYINPGFENTVLSHIIGNYMNNSPYPLYLAIHGKKGEGKTFQTLRVCSKYQIVMYYISGAQLCGSYEKDSIGDIEENFNEALYKYNSDNEFSVFVIDDFHLSIASTEVGIGRTVNSQILIGYLMNLADKAKASKSLRIPVILLGNDFNNLYEPLTRDGRMDFYEWNPSTQEKIAIVLAHFDDIVDRRDISGLQSLVQKYSSNPISFFTEVKNDIGKQMLSQKLASNRNWNLMALLAQLNASTTNVQITLSQIEQLMIARLNSANLAIHEERTGLHHA